MNLDKHNKKYGYKTFSEHILVSSSRERGEYGSWSENYSVSIQQRVEKCSKYPDVNSSFDFEPGAIAYLITVVYSSGDSFGKSKNGCVEDIWLFKNPKVAMDFKRHILTIEKKRTWDNTPKHSEYNFSNDEEMFDYKPDSVPWNHYFETFEDCILTMVMVEPDYEEL